MGHRENVILERGMKGLCPSCGGIDLIPMSETPESNCEIHNRVVCNDCECEFTQVFTVTNIIISENAEIFA